MLFSVTIRLIQDLIAEHPIMSSKLFLSLNWATQSCLESIAQCFQAIGCTGTGRQCKKNC